MNKTKEQIEFETLIHVLTDHVYNSRKSRQTHPDGKFDSANRWYPTDVEDPTGSVSSVRTPSRAWPYSYMSAARTKKHCRELVERCLAQQVVPKDVAKICANLLNIKAA